jgi:hypothetical protein
MDDSSREYVRIPLVWNTPTCDRCGQPNVEVAKYHVLTDILFYSVRAVLVLGLNDLSVMF